MIALRLASVDVEREEARRGSTHDAMTGPVLSGCTEMVAQRRARVIEGEVVLQAMTAFT
jgi:hypothetical protein